MRYNDKQTGLTVEVVRDVDYILQMVYHGGTTIVLGQYREYTAAIADFERTTRAVQIALDAFFMFQSERLRQIG